MASLILMLDADPKGEFLLDRERASVGRSADCDIVVDNLGVSRHHCTIIADGDHFVVEDNGSNNGTFVNGEEVERHVLVEGDRITLGKHSLVFSVAGTGASLQSDSKAGGDGGPAEMTMFVDGQALAKSTPKEQRGKLCFEQGGRTMERSLLSEVVSFGKGGQADYPLRGLFIKPVQATIEREAAGFRLKAVPGLRKVLINGSPVDEHLLRDGDRISVGKNSFTFRRA